MAFDLDKFARASEFSFKLVSVGVVRCESLSADLLREARKLLNATDFDSKKLARWLLREMAKRPSVENFNDTDPIEGASLTVAQLATITDPELESFSEHVLKKNPYLISAHGSKELLRIEGQSACDFLAKVIVHRGNEEKAQMDRIIQSATKPLFTESTLNSIKRSLTASNQFEDLIKKYSGKSALDSIKESITASNQIDDLRKRLAGDATLAASVFSQRGHEPRMLNMPPMQFPKNPIDQTNRILESLTGQIEDMRPLVAQGAELIRSMNDTALLMQGDYIANAAQSNNQTKKAMKVAVLSVIVSAVGLIASSIFSYLSYADGKANAVESKKQGDAFEKLTKDLMTAQHEERVTLTKALVDMKQTLPLGKK